MSGSSPALITAGRRRTAALVTATVVLALLALGLTAYGTRAYSVVTESSATYAEWAWAPVALILAVQTTLYLLERPYRATSDQQEVLDGRHVAVLMPVFNEDDGYLRSALRSLLAQSRLPDSVHIVDDGSECAHRATRRWWCRVARDAGIATSWQRTANAGKRHAQVRAASRCPEADIFVTIDSDAHLAPDALHEVLQPLADPRNQVVAGVVAAHNNRNGFLSRMTDLWYVTTQLVDRSALSPLGGVMVASGSLAAYRAELLRDHLHSYLGERFFGRPVAFSDDSMLTLYGLMRGRVVQQPTAIVFSAMPETVSHHLRQYLRWMRGSTIRALWRIRYLPPTHPAYLAQLLRWFQQLTCTALLIWLTLLHLHTDTHPPTSLFLVPLVIVSGQTLRYLTLTRSDQKLRSQLATWALTPLALLWSWTVLRPVRWYGLLTCMRTGWGTRADGAEVVLPIQSADGLQAPKRTGTAVPTGG
ncbi:glycosyltransferase [Streptomyces sp. NPDC102451]|uniref:glycosyltransferase n=1 Tax=Streptomyces sp. NPDC102451 TaxID=3366177 RepID=UPI00380153C6